MRVPASSHRLAPPCPDSVHLGEVMATVKVTLPDGPQLTAAITRDSAEELELAHGDQVVVVIKSTEVMIGKPD
jgi:molybdopterin-binding protein